MAKKKKNNKNTHAKKAQQQNKINKNSPNKQTENTLKESKEENTITTFEEKNKQEIATENDINKKEAGNLDKLDKKEDIVAEPNEIKSETEKARMSEEDKNIDVSEIKKENKDVAVIEEKNSIGEENLNPSELKEENHSNTKSSEINKNEITLQKDTKKSYKNTFLYKHRKLICACISTAIISSLITITVINNNKNVNFNNDVQSSLIDQEIDIVKIGEKLEQSGLITTNPTYSLTHTFDSRFDNYRDNILDIYTTILDSEDTLQEVYIIKNDDAKRVEENLQEYKEKLVEGYKNKANSKDKLSIAKKSIIKTVHNVTYFIAAENHKEIDALLESELN